jgi:dihydrofolate reductase
VHRRRRVPRRLAVREQGPAARQPRGAVLSTTLALVAALDRAGGIGRGNALPWHLPDDLKRFKAITLGHPVLMGRRTAESLGRALPGRRNLVLTRSGTTPFAGMDAVASLDEAVALAGDGTLMVIGGGEVFSLALPRATRMHLTHVDTVVDGADAFFPRFDATAWRVKARAPHAADARHAWPFEFVDYARA